MKQEKVVVINGRRYDALTGMPIKSTSQDSKPATVVNSHAKTVHSRNQKSKTLDRRVAKKPEKHAAQPSSRPHQPGRSMDIAVSKHVSKFGPRQIKEAITKTVLPQKPDIGPVKHPLTSKVEKTRIAPPQPKTNQEVKKDAISKALEQSAAPSKKKFKEIDGRKKALRIGIPLITVLLLAGIYLAYIALPGLSVNIAGIRAGIDASYPNYKPDGYKFKGTTYQDGEISIKYQLRTSGEGFTLKQAKTSLESTSLRDQVDKDQGGDFITTKERGLTIYAYDGGATWIDSGIVYSIESSAPISSEQIRKIATSL